jgi:hypothetical protein
MKVLQKVLRKGSFIALKTIFKARPKKVIKELGIFKKNSEVFYLFIMSKRSGFMAYVKFDNTKYYIGEQVIVIERISSY